VIGAIVAYASSQGFAVPGLGWVFPSLLGLLVSMFGYAVLFYLARFTGRTYGPAGLDPELDKGGSL